MNKFRKPHGGGGKDFRNKPERSGFGRPAYGRRDDGPQKKYDATCSNCGKACQVPFRPNGVKPVYCSNCFNSPRKENPARDAAFRPAPQRSDYSATKTNDQMIIDLKQQVNALNIKIDSVLKILEGKSVPETRPEDTPLRQASLQEAIRKNLVKKRAAKKAAVKK